MDAQIVLGARSLGLGQVSSALPENQWSVFGNPAMMDQEQRVVSFYGVRNFGFNELSDIAAVAVIPTQRGTVGAGMHRFGDELFSETRFRIAYKNAFKKFHYGGVVNYTSNSIEGYGSDGAIGFDAGIAAQPLKGLWIGGYATNVNQPTIGRESDELERKLTFGATYNIADRALIASEVVKDVRFPASYRGGIELYIVDGLTGRAGVTTEPTTVSFGMGYNAENWGINLAVQKHQVLNLSPGLDINVFW